MSSSSRHPLSTFLLSSIISAFHLASWKGNKGAYMCPPPHGTAVDRTGHAQESWGRCRDGVGQRRRPGLGAHRHCQQEPVQKRSLQA